jgi:hypothetical protein
MRTGWLGVLVPAALLSCWIGPRGVVGQSCNGRELVLTGIQLEPTSVVATVEGVLSDERPLTADRYAVTVPQPGTYRFTFCEGEGFVGSADFDTWLCLFDESFQLLAEVDDSCGLRSELVLPLSPGSYYLAVSGFGTSAGNYTLAYFSEGAQPCLRCNDRCRMPSGSISPTDVPQTVSGSVGPTEADDYTVTVEADFNCTFTLCSNGGDASFDTWLCLLDEAGSAIEDSDNVCGLLPEISRFLAAGTYHVAVSGFGESAGAYTLAYYLVSFPYIRCDFNCDADPDLSDAVAILRHLFQGGAGSCCPQVEDCNTDGGLDLSDAVFLLNHLFLGGGTPLPPFPDCGGLDCQGNPSCS